MLVWFGNGLASILRSSGLLCSKSANSERQERGEDEKGGEDEEGAHGKGVPVIEAALFCRLGVQHFLVPYFAFLAVCEAYA